MTAAGRRAQLVLMATVARRDYLEDGGPVGFRPGGQPIRAADPEASPRGVLSCSTRGGDPAG